MHKQCYITTFLYFKRRTPLRSFLSLQSSAAPLAACPHLWISMRSGFQPLSLLKEQDTFPLLQECYNTRRHTLANLLKSTPPPVSLHCEPSQLFCPPAVPANQRGGKKNDSEELGNMFSSTFPSQNGWEKKKSVMYSVMKYEQVN